MRTIILLQFIGCSLVTLSICGCKTLDRLAQVGDTPPLTNIQNPTMHRDYRPVHMPMPTPDTTEKPMNSLWQTGSRGFFKDQRASRVGDILTVAITTNDKAVTSNTTTRNRNSSEKIGVDNFMGLETNLTHFLPDQVNPSKLIGLTSNPTHSGAGTINRSEVINLTVAATIIQILPNGNYVINGRQEFRVNYDIRDVTISGIVRGADITSANTISLDKISEARLSYGGRGQLDDVQQPPWGMQILDAVSPL